MVYVLARHTRHRGRQHTGNIGVTLSLSPLFSPPGAVSQKRRREIALCEKERSEVGAAAAAEGLSLTSVRIILTLCRHAGNVLVGGTGGRDGCSRTLKNQPGGGEKPQKGERVAFPLSLHPGTESLLSPPPFVCVSIAGNSL